MQLWYSAIQTNSFYLTRHDVGRINEQAKSIERDTPHIEVICRVHVLTV